MLTRNREQQKYVILAAAWLIYFCNIGVITYGVSAITAPMIEELKFPIGVAVALCTAMQGLCGPVVGEIVSRSGSKTALLLGNMILAVAFFIIGCVPLTGARFTVLYGIFVGAGMGFAGNVGVQSLINSWFMANEIIAKAKEADGFVFGSPVYYAHPSGQVLSLLDRVFYAGSSNFAYKPGAVVVTARRAGTTAALDALNKYLLDTQMPVVSSTYWNMVFGPVPELIGQDKEGLQTMRNLGHNLAWLMKCIHAGKQQGVQPMQAETSHRTNFNQ